MPQPIGAKFCLEISPRPSFMMPVQNFGGLFPKKIWGAKNMQLWRDFGQLQSLSANISGTDKDILNQTRRF